MARLDGELLRHALQLARKNGYAEVELSVDTARFTATLAAAPLSSPSAPSDRMAIDRTAPEPKAPSIDAPLVGYYRESAKGLRVGQKVKRGDAVAEIAALGILNEVESKVDGEIIEVLVQPDQAVEYGQPLAIVKPL